MSPKIKYNNIPDILLEDDNEEGKYQELPGIDLEDLSHRYKILHERRVLDGEGGYYPLRSYVNKSIIRQLVFVCLCLVCSILSLLLKIVPFLGMILSTYV